MGLGEKVFHKRGLVVIFAVGLVIASIICAFAAGPAPVRTVLVGPQPWTHLQTDSSGDFLVKPAAAENLAGEPFTVAKEAPTVDFTIYPEQVNLLNPLAAGWSQWAEACIGPDGCLYSAIGDEGGPDAETFIYQYDPKENAVRRVFSFQALMGHKPGDWGYGKIHGRMHADKDGWIYFTGYWGNWPQEKDLNERYFGGVVGRYNIYSGISELLGTPVPGVSWHGSSIDFDRGLIYLAGQNWAFACYDLNTGQLKYYGCQDLQVGSPNCIVDLGMAYFSVQSNGESHFAKYDPVANKVYITKAMLPGNGEFRAATRVPAADGWFYCMTASGGGEGNGHLFRFNTETEAVEDLGMNFGKGYYTTSITLSPDGRYIYYMPGSHGNCADLGTPVVQFDIQTRQRKVVAFLEQYYETKYNYHFWGSFSVVASPDGSTLFVSINGGIAKSDGTPAIFGKTTGPALLAIHIPASERAG